MKILKAKFLDSKYKQLEIEFISDYGIEKKARIYTPDNFEFGKNKYFDAVCEQFNINDLKEEADAQNEIAIKKNEWRRQREKNSILNRAQETLFKAKVDFLNSKIMASSDREQRKAIRKASTPLSLTLIQYEIVKEYAEKNDIDFFSSALLVDQKSEDNDE